MSQENLELFRGGLAAWNEGDYEAIVNLCHPEVEWTFSDRLPDATGHIRGREEVRRFFQTFTGDWSEISIRADRVVDAGDHVVANVHFLARGRDGIEASMSFVHVWTVRDGTDRPLSRLPDVRRGPRGRRPAGAAGRSRLACEQRLERAGAGFTVPAVGALHAAIGSDAARRRGLVASKPNPL